MACRPLRGRCIALPHSLRAGGVRRHGCGEASPLPEFKPTADARVAWRASVGSSEEYVFFPALRGGAVYAAGYDGNGHAPGRGQRQAGLARGHRVAALGRRRRRRRTSCWWRSDKGVVLAYSLEGKQLWRSQVTSEVLSAPRTIGNLVVVRTGDGRIFGLDAANGERKWEYQATPAAAAVARRIRRDPVRELVLAGLPAGKLVALNLSTGAQVWDAVVAQPKGANELERVTDIAAAPVVSDGAGLRRGVPGPHRAATTSPRARCSGAATRRPLRAWRWTRVTVYMTDESGVVVAFDKTTGATLWKQDKLLARGVSGPAAVGSLVVVGDYRGLRALPGARGRRFRGAHLDRRQRHLGAAGARGQQRAGADARAAGSMRSPSRRSESRWSDVSCRMSDRQLVHRRSLRRICHRSLTSDS